MGEESPVRGSARRLDANAAKPLLKSVSEPEARILGKGSGFGVAIDLDGLLGRVHYHFAVFTMLEVLFDRGLQRGIKRFVEVVR